MPEKQFSKINFYVCVKVNRNSDITNLMFSNKYLFNTINYGKSTYEQEVEYCTPHNAAVGWASASIN